MIRVNAAAASSVSPSVTRTYGGGFAAFVLAMFCATALMWTAGADAAGAETEIIVEPGVDGRFRMGRPLPVTVTVSADRLISGDLTVFVRNSPTGAVSTPVEMAGGTVKEITVLVQSGPWDSNISVQAQLRAGGDEIASERAQANSTGEDELVGVLPDLVQQTSLPNTAALGIDIGVARFSSITVEQLVLGQGSLDIFGTVAATSTDLADLTDADHAVLADWLSNGGVLLIDEAIGTPLPGLPNAWQPGPEGYAFAGQGEIRLTAGAATAGTWEDILLPTPLNNLNQQQMLGEWMQNGNWSSVTSTLGDDAGFRLPPITTVVILLLGYIAIVGPIAFFALAKMGRHTQAWAVVPALALLGAGVVWVAGSDLRGSTRRSHATLIENHPAGASVTSYVLAGSKRGDNISLELPLGWNSLARAENRFGPGSETPTLSAGEPARLQLDVDPGGFGLFGAGGSDADPAYQLDVTAVAISAEEVEGTVTNNSPVPLREVSVYSSQKRITLGTIEAGASETFTLRNVDRFEMFMQDFDARFNGDPFGRDVRDEGPVNSGLLSERFRAGGVNFRSPGQVVAVGWTRDAPGPFGTPDAGRTGVVARTNIGSRFDLLGGLEFRRYLVRGPETVRLDGNNFQEFGPEAAGIYRFVIPPELADRAREADLVVDIPRFARQVDAWNGDAWVALSGDQAAGNAAPGTAVALPDGAFVAGQATLRMGLSFEGGPERGRDLFIRERTADDPPAAEAPAAATTDGEQEAAE